ncbi:MAG: hypothetical protein HRU21_10295 [Pseudomonadales bacterium]|nr:hypothetical protein [Pseudomonadales bacterium]
MQFDLTQAEQSSGGDFELIPAKTVAPVIMHIRGTKRTQAGDAEYLDIEYTVTAGKYERRKVFGMNMITSNGTDGHNKAVEISTSFFLEVVQSAYGIKDLSAPDAMEYLRSFDTDSLQGIEFLARIGIEKDKTGQYEDKNVVSGAVTPASKTYAGFEPKPMPKAGVVNTTSTQQAAAPSAASKPAWAS